MLMEIMYYVTEKQLYNLAYNNISLGVAIGIFIGFAILSGLAYLLILVYQRNFKMYLLQQDVDSQKDIKTHLDLLYQTTEYLARKTNSRYFKDKHNQINRLKKQLEDKYLQN